MIDTILEKGLMPDFAIRAGIRSLNRDRLAEVDQKDPEHNQEKLMTYIEKLRNSPIAILTEKANEQHYELPPEFFKLVLGKHLKYSSCYYPEGVDDLDEAERIMLEITAERAELEDGQNILELGCGWGSLTLFMAEQYPNSNITAVSNSAPQREFIRSRAKERKLKNIRVITADMNSFATTDKFDRVVSVEMFEHMKNYEKLFNKVSSWLTKSGKLFVHIFAHKDFAYDFEVRDESDWMSKYFFSGGTMPSSNLFYYMCHPLKLQTHWRVSGTHYHKTSEAWLRNMDANINRIEEIFKQTYGDDWKKWINYWRVFFLAVSELFRTKDGNEWLVNHYLFAK